MSRARKPSHEKGEEHCEHERALNDPEWERNFTVLLKRYLRNEFFFDAIANLPIFVYDIAFGFPRYDFDREITLAEFFSDVYVVFMFLKIFRLAQLSEISRSLDRIKDTFAYYNLMKRYFYD